MKMSIVIVRKQGYWSWIVGFKYFLSVNNQSISLLCECTASNHIFRGVNVRNHVREYTSKAGEPAEETEKETHTERDDR